MKNCFTAAATKEYVDAHCHILPGVDHGAKDPSVAFSMAEALQKMGFTSCFATPHYYFYEESADDFIARRDISFASTVFPEGFVVIPGAEIAYDTGISKRCDLSKLTIRGTDRVLIELPSKRFSKKTIEEFYEISLQHGVKIILAHAERYLGHMSFKDYTELSEVEDILFQINLFSLKRFKPKLFLDRLMYSGIKVIFGTDAHDNDFRITHSDIGLSYLEKKTEPDFLEHIMKCEEVLL
jgi:protein-tyrosine phosphatase